MTKRGGPEALAARGSARLVGRDGERAGLERALAGVEEGRGGLVLVAGEAGVGKTRLVAETLAASRLVVLDGSASQVATHPYGPIVTAFRSFLRFRPDGLRDCGRAPLEPPCSPPA